MRCLICKRLRKTFMLNMCCGDGSNTIKDYIIEYVGYSIAEYLDDNQGVCKTCQHVIDEIIKIKLEFSRAIRSDAEIKYVPKLGKYWTFCSKYAECNSFDCTSNTPPEPNSRDTTPIMTVSRTKSYNSPIEKIFEEREAMKKELRDYNNQQSNIGSKKNRKATKLNRSKSAIVDKLKQDLKEGTKRMQSETHDRSISVASNMSIISSTSNNEKRRYAYTDNEHMEENDSNKPKMTYKCPYETCKHLDLMRRHLYTTHMIEVHNSKPNYTCKYCGFEYFIREHLKIHWSQTHDILPVLCGICGNQTSNVTQFQQHADQHTASSFKCIYCDMAFCTKKECNKHIFSNHRQRRRIFLRRKVSQTSESIILNQIDYKKPNIPNETKSPTITDTVNNNKCIKMNITPHEPKQFKRKTFRELNFIQRHPPSEWDTDAFSLGDEVVQGENLDERIAAELTKYGKPCDIFHKVTHRPPNAARGISDRTTPLQRSNTPLGDPELDMPPFVGGNYYKPSRELESESTEVANYMNGAEDSEADGQSDEVASDVESERQYLYGNTFVSSIPSPYIEKS